MFGFFVGTLCLWGMFRVARGGRRWGRGHGGHRRWFLRRAFEWLETTPGQEKVILEAAETLEGEGRKLREEMWKARTDLGEAMKGEVLDEAKLRSGFERQQSTLAEAQQRYLGAVGKVFESLQADQRAALAEYLSSRGWHGGYGHCGGRAAC